MSDKDRTIENAQGHLMAYAVEWLAEWSGQDPSPLLAGLPAGASPKLEPYRQLLAGAWPLTKPRAPLLSIFSRVKAKEDAAEPQECYWLPQPLSLAPVAPVDEATARQADLTALWQGFHQEASKALDLPADSRFEAFAHLLHKWTWAAPCRYGEPGVSLYDEFRALSALVHASRCAERPAGQFLLVGGDIPGIQKTIYTITSKGAAKGLRGRSFFIQLLGDAVVRRLLAELDLPQTNIIYTAGGNFLLLAPAGANDQVKAIGVALNEELLKTFEGDLALCLACQSVEAGEVGEDAFASHASRVLHNKIGRQKRRRFVELTEPNWDAVFGPHGQGGVDFCAVCQHELRPGEIRYTVEEGSPKCDQCHGFEELATAIARDPHLLFVGSRRFEGQGEGWQELLWQLTGQWYDFSDLKPTPPQSTRVYSVNSLRFLDKGAHGFRLIANTTPRKDGQVATFEDLADGAQGLERVGVLRMDVDDLGRVLTQWLPERTMASTSALSHALDRFFSGWLDAICGEVMADPQMGGVPKGREGLLYVIYAGGDDLFVVGAWDLMPPLAERIQSQFAAYVGHNPRLHISAGITLEDRKFPLYQAAERAGDALDHVAKEWTRQVKGRKVKKNAVCFLSQAVGWEEQGYPFVKGLAEELVRLTQDEGVPRSLLTTMRAIHDRYYADVRQARERGLEGDKVYYGPWMWRKVYQLSRTAQRYDKEETREVAKAIKRLETEVLTKEQMPYVGLATRWAEYLTRGGQKK